MKYKRSLLLPGVEVDAVLCELCEVRGNKAKFAYSGRVDRFIRLRKTKKR